MAIISSLKEEVDLLSDQTRMRFDNQNRVNLQERDLLVKRIMMEVDPLKADVGYLKERENLVSAVMGHNQLAQRDTG